MGKKASDAEMREYTNNYPSDISGEEFEMIRGKLEGKKADEPRRNRFIGFTLSRRF